MHAAHPLPETGAGQSNPFHNQNSLGGDTEEDMSHTGSHRSHKHTNGHTNAHAHDNNQGHGHEHSHGPHSRGRKPRSPWHHMKELCRQAWEILRNHAKAEALWIFLVYTGVVTLHVMGVHPLT